MRSRQVIEKEYADYNLHIREVLLDMRDLMVKAEKKSRKKKEVKNVK